MPQKPKIYRRTNPPANPRDHRATACKRGYDRRWREARARYLLDHPLCVECETIGQVTAATVVDHIKPHRGDEVLFWDESNWQPLCTYHHNVKTAQGQ